MSPLQRFTRDRPCPVCGGHDGAARGKAERCYGYLDSTGGYARCTRVEHSGELAVNADGTYSHLLAGECRCGARHGPDNRVDDTVRHTIRDVAGHPVAVHVRRGSGSGKKVWWEQPDGSPGLNGAHPADMLYRLEALRDVPPGAPIMITEGETAADAVARLGYAVLGTVTGAGKETAPLRISPTAAAQLAGRAVHLFPDNDAPGRAHMAACAQVLASAGANPMVLDWPEAPDKGDAVDLVARLGVDVAREQIGEMIAAAELGEAAPDQDHHHADDQCGGGAGAAGEDTKVIPSPKLPYQTAQALVAHAFTDAQEQLLLRRWRGGWWRWRGSHWTEDEQSVIERTAYNFTAEARYWEERSGAGKPPELKPWAPNRYKLGDLLHAMGSATLCDATGMPAWLDVDHRGGLPADEIVACANGLLHVGTRTLLDHTPLLFNQVAVPFDYRPDAPPPARWLAFLREIWGEDEDSIAALQEFFGYVISNRIDLHKILLLVGPTRSGKGVIARVLKHLVGAGNHCGPTLASLGTNFGLSPLIGKTVAVVADARLGGANVHQVVERLLSVSGEDVLTVDRKYREPWTGTLGTRFLVISNELPRFGDASGAIANRFLVLVLTRSFLGRENPNLTRELLAETPGIFTWALEGLARLQERDRFSEPESSKDAVLALQDLVSPVAAFVRERCTVGGEVACDELYGSWKVWADDNGHRPGSAQSFGRDLRAVVPALRVYQPREEDHDRRRWYRGVSLTGNHNGPPRVPPRASGVEEELARDGTRTTPLWSQDAPDDDEVTRWSDMAGGGA